VLDVDQGRIRAATAFLVDLGVPSDPRQAHR
jgi:hypothetical protein